MKKYKNQNLSSPSKDFIACYILGLQCMLNAGQLGPWHARKKGKKTFGHEI